MLALRDCHFDPECTFLFAKKQWMVRILAHHLKSINEEYTNSQICSTSSFVVQLGFNFPANSTVLLTILMLKYVLYIDSNFSYSNLTIYINLQGAMQSNQRVRNHFAG
jgi:hypothetical protein